jgi:hypothetical protein
VKLFDFLCRKCSRREERYVERPEQPQECVCGGEMVKLPPATRTNFKFADKRYAG